VERTLVDRPVAKKTKCDPIFIPILRRERHSDCERHVGGDDRVPAIHVAFLVEVMHRAAQSARAAGRFPEQLRHAGVRARSASERVSMIAISRYQIIIRPRRCDRAADYGFLPDIEMTEAADFLRLILLTGPLLETPDEQHQREHLDLVALRLRHKAGLDRARLSGGHAGGLGSATQVETENEKRSEERRV